MLKRDITRRCVCGGELIELKNVGDIYVPFYKKYKCTRCGKLLDENELLKSSVSKELLKDDDFRELDELKALETIDDDDIEEYLKNK